MANIGTPRTKNQLVRDSLLQNAMPGILRYQGICIGDGSPGAIELFLNGEPNHRLALPDNSYVFGMFVGSAWNKASNTACSGTMINFGVRNTNGTIDVHPTNLSGTDGNPIVVRSGPAGTTWAIAADDTNKALVVRFTPSANQVWHAFGHLYFAFSGDKMITPNMFEQTN